jgi:peptidoglycan/LPS O-acetylase OafA/YrhL
VEAPTERFRNLETLRLVAASSVIFSHAFLMVYGDESREPLHATTGVIVGALGVVVFFIISGMLVAQSLERADNTLDYLWKRFLRIYPAYFVSLIAVALLIAPPYWQGGSKVWTFLHYLATFGQLKVLADSLPVQFYPGWVGAVLNGSLWTIPIEVLCYFILAMIGLVSLLRIGPMAILFVAATVGLLFAKEQPESYLVNLAWGAPPFAAGVLMYLLHSRLGWRPRPVVLLLCALLLAVEGGLHILDWAASLPLAVLVLGLATTTRFTLGSAAVFGDFSYGTYLYGWPIAQVIRANLGTISPWTLTAIAVPVAIAAGALSWHLVEKHALRLKRLRLVLEVRPGH